MIAFFGMGLLGGNFVRALCARGESVHIYNRTDAKARALEAEGAIAFQDPAEAVRGAERVHLTLSDDAAVDEVLDRAKAGFSPRVLVIDHSTTSVTGALARAAKWRERGIDFLHAPVFMGPQNARESTGIMLMSGDPAIVERARASLAAMTGKLVELGPRPERAAAFKLMGNLFLMFMTAGVAEMFALGKALDVPAKEAATLFDAFNPGMSLGARAKRMLDGNFEQPSWELAMARKDARLMMEEGERAHVVLAMLPAIAQVMDRYLERGHAHHDWTVIAKDAL